MIIKHEDENILTIKLVKEEIEDLYEDLEKLSICNTITDELREKLEIFI